MGTSIYPEEETVKADAPGPPDRTRLATLALHVSSVMYLMAAGLLGLAPFTWDSATEDHPIFRASVAWVLCALCAALAALALLLVRGLRRRRRWAWITALALFVLYLPSLFLPLGAVGLFGLLSEGTRTRFAAARARDGRRGR